MGKVVVPGSPARRTGPGRLPADVTDVAAGWHLSQGLSYREVEERLAERNIEVDRATVYRWIHRLRSRGDATQPAERGRTDGPCRLEEVQLTLWDKECWLYRARDPDDRVVDMYLSSVQDGVAARRFFERAGELRVWEPEEEHDDESAPTASVEGPVVAEETVNLPVLDTPVVVAGPAFTRSRHRIEPWLRMRRRPKFDDQGVALDLPLRHGPFIRRKQRSLTDGKSEPDAPPTIIEAQAVPTSVHDPAEVNSAPALTRRAQTWILGARAQKKP